MGELPACRVDEEEGIEREERERGGEGERGGERADYCSPEESSLIVRGRGRERGREGEGERAGERERGREDSTWISEDSERERRRYLLSQPLPLTLSHSFPKFCRGDPLTGEEDPLKIKLSQGTLEHGIRFSQTQPLE